MVGRAFGLDVSERALLAFQDEQQNRSNNKDQKRSSMSPDMQWRLNWLADHVGEGKLFDRRVFPKLEDFERVF